MLDSFNTEERPVRLPPLSWHYELRRERCRPARPLDPLLDNARPIFKAAMDQGLYYFDCANNYGMCVGARCRRATPEALPARELRPLDKLMYHGKGPQSGRSLP